MDWSLQARSTATSPEYSSGWVLRLVHLASAENRLDVVKDNVCCLHSTTKSRGALHDEPLDLTISCPNFNVLNVFVPWRGSLSRSGDSSVARTTFHLPTRSAGPITHSFDAVTSYGAIARRFAPGEGTESAANGRQRYDFYVPASRATIGANALVSGGNTEMYEMPVCARSSTSSSTIESTLPIR